MIKMGFHEQLVQLIMVCISTVSLTVLQDGHQLGPVMPRRELRQRDPLFPYLFTICAEALSLLIRAKETSSHIHGCQITRGAPRISHSFFVDDCFIYLRATKDEACTVKQTLLEYGSASDNESISINLQSP